MHCTNNKDDEIARLKQTIAKLETDLRLSWDALSIVKKRLEDTEKNLSETRQAYDTISNATFWRLTKPLRTLIDNARPFIGHLFLKKRTLSEYEKWIERYDTIGYRQKKQMQNRVCEISSPPIISVLMPIYNTHERMSREAVESVCNQIYPHWELCIAGDASELAHVKRILKEYEAKDTRIKFCYRDVDDLSEASNSALALATGDFVALLRQDDVLPPGALYHAAEAILANPESSLFYSDEDKLDSEGRRYGHYFKPDWSPDLFLSHNIFAHLGIYKRELLEKIGGFHKGFESAQEYDLALRCIEKVGHGRVVHIPKILYHRRKTEESTATNTTYNDYDINVAVKAISQSLDRQKIRAEVCELAPGAGLIRVKYELPEKRPLASIIIPTRDAAELVRRCFESIVEKTTYDNYEIVLVDNGSADTDALSYFAELAKEPFVTVLEDEGAFNYSRLNNRAVELCKGEFVCLLNNDIEVITPDWLIEMVAHAIRPGIGVVGARLWYPDDTLQHGGVILGVKAPATHAHHEFTRDNPGYNNRACLVQNLSAVTAACLVVRKAIYLEVGGLNEKDLPVSYNDIDFCLRVRNAGYRNLWTPFAELYHYESRTRGRDDDDPAKAERERGEVRYMEETYGGALYADPYYNANLSLDELFELAFPPRIEPAASDRAIGGCS